MSNSHTLLHAGHTASAKPSTGVSDAVGVPESEEFRARAESLRQLAAGILDGTFRDGLLTLASDYDRQAEAVTRLMVRRLEQQGFVVIKGGRGTEAG